MKKTTKIKIILYRILPSSLFTKIRRIWQMTFGKLRNRSHISSKKSFTKEDIVDLDYGNGVNFKIKINPLNKSVDQDIFMYHSYEPDMVKVFKNNIKPGFRVLDIGANIGHHSLVFSKLAGNAGKVIAFEPIPRIYNQFLESVQLNEMTNIEIKNYALSNNVGKVNLYLDEENYGHSSIIKDKENMTKHIEIQTERLDNLNVGKIDFVKIDVEGYEWNVIEGGMKTFTENKPVIVMEYSPEFYQASDASHSTKILEWLVRNNYKILDIDDRMKEIKNIGEFVKEFEPTLREQTNLLCIQK